MDSFEQNEENTSRNEEEESYSVIEEHVRKRPFDRRKFLWGVLRLFMSAIVFGTVAGFVFLLVTGGEGLSRLHAEVTLLTEAPEITKAVTSKPEEPSPEPTEVPAAISETPKNEPQKDSSKKPSDASAETSKTPAAPDAGDSSKASVSPDTSKPAFGSAGSGKKPSRVTPTPTAEELEAEAIRTYERFQAALNGVFEETCCHLAFVTSTEGEEKGIFGIAGKTTKTAGLILGKDSRRLFILLNHLPEGEKHQVTFADSTRVPARVFASDPSTGLTIMAASLRDLDDATLESCTAAELGNSYNLRRGDLVLAIGTTLCESGDYMRGTVLSTEYPHNVPDREYRLLSTDIPCPEKAEGFVADPQGRIVGVFSDKFTPEGTNLLAAIPISMIKTLLTNMMNREQLVSLGIMGRDISDDEAESLGIPAGIYVLFAEEESAALEAGIRTGDVVIGINGKEITSLLLLEEELYRHEPGDSLSVTLMRLSPDGYEEVSCEAILSKL